MSSHFAVFAIVVEPNSSTPIKQLAQMPPHEVMLQQLRPGQHIVVVTYDPETGTAVVSPALDITIELAEYDGAVLENKEFDAAKEKAARQEQQQLLPAPVDKPTGAV